MWNKIRADSGVKGRWHDNRHTLVAEAATPRMPSNAPMSRSVYRIAKNSAPFPVLLKRDHIVIFFPIPYVIESYFALKLYWS
jgi:hypothetical protein